MAESPYLWDGDNVVLVAGFHSFTLVYIEPLAGGGVLLAVYGWRPGGPYVLPPQCEERPDLGREIDGEIEIPCRDKAEARALVEAMFRVRGWEIQGGPNG